MELSVFAAAVAEPISPTAGLTGNKPTRQYTGRGKTSEAQAP